MKRLTPIATMFGAAALLSASALAQAPAPAGASPTTPVDASASTSTTTTTATTTNVPMGDTPAADTLATDPNAAGGGALPNTGGEPMLFVLGGLALMGTALVMRRKAGNFA